MKAKQEKAQADTLDVNQTIMSDLFTMVMPVDIKGLGN